MKRKKALKLLAKTHRELSNAKIKLKNHSKIVNVRNVISLVISLLASSLFYSILIYGPIELGKIARLVFSLSYCFSAFYFIIIICNIVGWFILYSTRQEIKERIVDLEGKIKFYKKT